MPTILRWCLGLVLAVALQAPGYGQDKDAGPAFRPNRTVTIVVPYSPGGGTDAVARLIAKALEERWGQTVLVDNRTGGSGSVGAGIVARAAPDGHTMVLAVSGIAINAHLMKLPYDTATAFAPVTAVARSVSTLVATPSLPADDLRGLVALVNKEGPDKRSFASPDPGSRLNAERIFDKVGIKLLHIPYKGSSSFIGDIAEGRVDVGITSITSALSLLKAGKLKSLGINTPKRIAILPEISTFREQGYDIEETSWYGLFAPAGTPAATVEAIHRDIVQVLASPAFQAKLAEQGALPGGDTPAAFSERFQRDIKESGETIRRLGLSAD